MFHVIVGYGEMWEINLVPEIDFGNITLYYMQVYQELARIINNKES